jgi:hypothetical protein
MTKLNIPAAILAVLVTSGTLGTLGHIADVNHREVLAAAARTTVVAKATVAREAAAPAKGARNGKRPA